jgi:hypothetical protein
MKIDPAAGDSSDPPVEDPSPVESSTSSSATVVSPGPVAPPVAREVAAAMERTAAAIAGSYASLRVALSDVCAVCTPHKRGACR